MLPLLSGISFQPYRKICEHERALPACWLLWPASLLHQLHKSHFVVSGCQGVTHWWLRHAGLEVFVWSPEPAENLPLEWSKYIQALDGFKFCSGGRADLTAARPEGKIKKAGDARALSMHLLLENSAETRTIKVRLVVSQQEGKQLELAFSIPNRLLFPRSVTRGAIEDAQPRSTEGWRSGSIFTASVCAGFHLDGNPSTTLHNVLAKWFFQLFLSIVFTKHRLFRRFADALE